MIDSGGFVTLSGKHPGIHPRLEIPAGGGRGDGLVEFHVVLARKLRGAEMLDGTFQASFNGRGLGTHGIDKAVQRLMHHVEGEVDESRRIPRLVCQSEHLIVGALIVLDEGLDRGELKDRMIMGQQQAMPETSDQ